jgi:uncharacterized membrane protein
MSSRIYNPLLIVIVIIALVGLADASYLTYEHYTGLKTLACSAAKAGEHSSCYDVQSSQWSKLAGIPVALMGVIGYLVILSTLAIRGEMGRMLTFVTAVMGLTFSVYLTYREAFTIHHYCEWCLGSAACLLVLTLLTGFRFLFSSVNIESSLDQDSGDVVL